MYTYIEIRRIDTDEVVKRIDATGKSESVVDRIEMWVLHNMDTDNFYTESVESDQQLTPIN